MIEDEASVMDFDKALEKATAWMDEIDGVVGVGQGEADGKPTIVVSVTLPEVGDGLPETFHGHPVVVDHTGVFSAHAPLESPE